MKQNFDHLFKKPWCPLFGWLGGEFDEIRYADPYSPAARCINIIEEGRKIWDILPCFLTDTSWPLEDDMPEYPTGISPFANVEETAEFKKYSFWKTKQAREIARTRIQVYQYLLEPGEPIPTPDKEWEKVLDIVRNWSMKDISEKITDSEILAVLAIEDAWFSLCCILEYGESEDSPEVLKTVHIASGLLAKAQELESKKIIKDKEQILQNKEDVIEKKDITIDVLVRGVKSLAAEKEGQIENFTKQTTKYVFKEEVKYFKIVYAGQELSPIQSYVGLRYIAQLLFNPGTSYNPYFLSQLNTKNDLSEQQIDCRSISKDNLGKEGLSISKMNLSFQDLIDRSTVSQLKKAVKEFEKDKVKSESEGDVDRKIECEESIEKINRELVNKKKVFLDLNLKKINDNVRKAINESIEKIKNISKPLSEHLKNSIKRDKAGYCYMPPEPIEWHKD